MAGKFIKFTSALAAISVILSVSAMKNTLAFDVEENSLERERIAQENSEILENIKNNQKDIKDKQANSKQLQHQIQEHTKKKK